LLLVHEIFYSEKKFIFSKERQKKYQVEKDKENDKDDIRLSVIYYKVSNTSSKREFILNKNKA
jgi:hypothetical protein